MKKCFLAIAALVGLAVLAAPVQATILVPGAPPVAITRLDSMPAGSIVTNGDTASTASFTAFDSTGHIALVATLYYAVYKESATGFLDFVYQLQASKKNSQDAILRSINSDMSAAAFHLDASFLRPNAAVPAGFVPTPPKGETPPTTAALSADKTDATFFFNSPFGPGSLSNVFILRSHVKGFKTGGTEIVTRESNTYLNTFAPGPEPSTLVLFAGCFLGLAGWTGWRRWKGQPITA